MGEDERAQQYWQHNSFLMIIFGCGDDGILHYHIFYQVLKVINGPMRPHEAQLMGPNLANICLLPGWLEFWVLSQILMVMTGGQQSRPMPFPKLPLGDVQEWTHLDPRTSTYGRSPFHKSDCQCTNRINKFVVILLFPIL